MKNRFQNLTYYSLPQPILFVLRKRVDAVFNVVALLALTI